MPLTMDNGVEREMTPEEIAEFKARQNEPQPVPHSVTRRQARQALLLNGLLDRVQPAIDAIDDPIQRGLAQIEWDDSLEYFRDRPLVLYLGMALSLSDETIDNLFRQAVAL